KSYDGRDLELTSETVPLRLYEIQKRMPDDVQLLEYAVLEDKVLMWVITRSSIKSGRTNISAKDLDQRVHGYVEMISHTASAATTLEEIRNEGKSLHGLLIEPIEQFLNKDDELCIVPDKSLTYLPFAALLSSSGNYLV